MKILQIIKTNEGARWAFNQAKWLYNSGVDIITVLPEASGGLAEEYKENGMTIVQADFSLPKELWKINGKIKEINEIVNKINPDIIHCHFVTNIIMLRLALRNSNIPRFFQVPGPLHLENSFYRKIEIKLSNENDYWGAGCVKTQSIYVNSGVPNKEVFLTYYGGYGGEETGKYEPNNTILRSEFNIATNEKIIGMVSYFYKPKVHLLQKRGIKGHEDFIDAIVLAREKDPTIRGIIIGDAWGSSQKYVEKIKHYAEDRAGNSIIFAGFREDLDKIYKELDVVVHPSHSENLGGAAESLAAGVPTISTNIGGFPDIVIDGITGITVDKKNPKQLSEAIIKMLSHYQESLVSAKKGQELVSNLLDIDNTAEQVLKVYEEILNRKT